MVNRLLTISIKVNSSLSSCAFAVLLKGIKTMRKNQTKGLLWDIWRAVFGGGTGNTGAGG